MRLLDRYIGRNVIGMVLTVAAALVLVFSFFDLIDEVDDVGRGSYTFARMLLFIVLSMPRLAYELLPVAALIGALVGLSILVSNGELVVVRAAGVPLSRIVFSVMKGGAVIMVFAVIIGEFVVPPAEETARNMKSVALANRIALKTRYGFWARDGQSYINIRKVLPGNQVEDIYIYEFDDQDRLQVSTFARRALYVDGQWLLESIEQTEISDAGVQSKRIARAAWDSLLRPDLINLVVVEPDKLSVYDLVQYIRFLRSNNQSVQPYRHALWVKMVYPVATAVMIFLAIPIVLGSRNAVNVGQRVVLGVVIGLVFNLLNQASGHLGVVYNLVPALSATMPTLVTFIIAVVLMRRVA